MVQFCRKVFLPYKVLKGLLLSKTWFESVERPLFTVESLYHYTALVEYRIALLCMIGCWVVKPRCEVDIQSWESMFTETLSIGCLILPTKLVPWGCMSHECCRMALPAARERVLKSRWEASKSSRNGFVLCRQLGWWHTLMS